MSSPSKAGKRPTAPAGTAGAGSAIAIEELHGYEEQELSRSLQVLVVVRRIAALLLLAWIPVFLLLEKTRWQVWLLLVAAGMMVCAIAFDRRLPMVQTRRTSVRQLVYVLVTVLLFHTVLIVATGGIESPFIVLYIPVLVISAVTIGSPRAFLGIAILPLLVIATLACGALCGFLPEFLPSFLGGDQGPRRAPIWLGFFAMVLAGTGIIGGLLGMFVRRALDRASHAAALARQEAVNMMQERNRELLELSGSLAHELKNPLASIQGLASLIARRLPEDSREAEQMGVLRGEVKRLGGILDEFLNFSRPVVSLAVREIRLSELVAAIVLLHEGEATRKGVTLVSEVIGSGPLCADERKVKQVLVNLLQNALDASPPGAPVTIRVRPGGVPAGSKTIFEVEDEGGGLAAEVRGRLFTLGATSKAAGSGLGLVIARSIAEQHGGSLVLEERSGGGVRAVFELPTKPAPIPPNPDPGEAAGGQP